jgi:hypothetical protein
MSAQTIELLKSGQLLSLSDGSNCGVILQKTYFAEFVGPGSAIGGMFDIGCVKIFTLGKVDFSTPITPGDRQQAFQKRIAEIEMMQNLCQSEIPLQRSVDLLEMLCDRFSVEEIRMLPNDVLAKIVGVLPNTIAMAWKQKFNLQSAADPTDSYEGLAFAT